MVKSPILFITFVRPEYARYSWNAIKEAKPEKLYFYSNKGRIDKEGEIEKNNEIRDYIKEIDWPCNLYTYFREECVDIYTSLWGAIDWLFDNEDYGIIIEEDCVATQAFFQFCDDLLPRYANAQKVRMISGNNYTPKYNPKNYDYFFSHVTHIYGWATWRDRWKTLDRKMTDWNQVKHDKIKKYYPYFLCRFWYRFNLQFIYDRIEKRNPWDYITLYNSIKNDQCSITPCRNLVFDIGVNGVHHHNTEVANYKPNIPVIDDISTSKYPETIETDKEFDINTFNHFVLKKAIKHIPKRIIQKMVSYVIK